MPLSTVSLSHIKLNGQLISGIFEGSIKILPQKSALLQNYPNPFNPETWIPYQLSQEAEVIIRIYNINGQLVRTLYFGRKPAGNYLSKNRAAYWNGRNQAGEKSATGAYFYTLKACPVSNGAGAGDFTTTRRMLLVK